jgi:hypothetical protein
MMVDVKRGGEGFYQMRNTGVIFVAHRKIPRRSEQITQSSIESLQHHDAHQGIPCRCFDVNDANAVVFVSSSLVVGGKGAVSGGGGVYGDLSGYRAGESILSTNCWTGVYCCELQ